MAGVPMMLDAAQPEISIQNADQSWLVEIVKANRRLKLKILNQDALPEFEVLDYSNE